MFQKVKVKCYNSETIWEIISSPLRLSTHPVISIHLLNLFILSKVNPGCNGTYRPLLQKHLLTSFQQQISLSVLLIPSWSRF